MAKEVASIDLEHPTMMLHYLNTIYEPQLSSPQMKKPFDVLAEGLLTRNSRDERI
jgi:hypothetical protein